MPSTNDANGNPTNNYSLNVWIKNDCPTARYFGGYNIGSSVQCADMPVGSYITQNFGYMMLNGQWGAYYDDNMVVANGLYSDEHVIHAWNNVGTAHGGSLPQTGSTHAGQWYMYTMTVDGNKDTHFYINGNEIELWSYPGSCQGGSTFYNANYGFGVLPGVDKTANYSGCCLCFLATPAAPVHACDAKEGRFSASGRHFLPGVHARYLRKCI